MWCSAARWKAPGIRESTGWSRRKPRRRIGVDRRSFTEGQTGVIAVDSSFRQHTNVTVGALHFHQLVISVFERYTENQSLRGYECGHKGTVGGRVLIGVYSDGYLMAVDVQEARKLIVVRRVVVAQGDYLVVVDMRYHRIVVFPSRVVVEAVGTFVVIHSEIVEPSVAHGGIAGESEFAQIYDVVGPSGQRQAEKHHERKE